MFPFPRRGYARINKLREKRHEVLMGDAASSRSYCKFAPLLSAHPRGPSGRRTAEPASPSLAHM